MVFMVNSRVYNLYAQLFSKIRDNYTVRIEIRSVLKKSFDWSVGSVTYCPFRNFDRLKDE